MYSVYLLIIFSVGLFASTLSYKFGRGTENLFLKEEEGTCDEWTERFARNQRTITAKLPPDLHGKWVSESCEVRPGPEFLIRKYQFDKNSSFITQQYYYSDESCTTPTYSVSAAGKFRFTAPSWVVPGAMDAEYLLTNVAVTAYSKHIADSLAHRVNRSCPGSVTKPWRPYRSYKVYSYIEVLRGDSGNTVQVIEDVDCIAGLHVVLHELQLVRLEHRKPLHGHHRRPGHHLPGHGVRSELFLGDIHTESAQRSFYHPTSYQPPLLKPQTSGCHVCHLVAKSTEQSPPQLHAKVKLPVYMSGVWISNRCETRPYGMFISRKLSFFGYNQTWKGEYNYYTDPKCTTPSFKIVARGRYRPGNPSMRVQGGTEYNFYVQQAEITPQSVAMVKNLNGHRLNTCGKVGSWKLHKIQDVTATKGCMGLGLRVPATEFDLVRMEIDHHGNTLLHLGHVDTDYKQHEQRWPRNGQAQMKRPSSYQTPLVQCKAYPSYSDHLQNSIFPEPYQYSLGNSASTSYWLPSISYFVLSLILVNFFVIQSGQL